MNLNDGTSNMKPGKDKKSPKDGDFSPDFLSLIFGVEVMNS